MLASRDRWGNGAIKFGSSIKSKAESDPVIVSKILMLCRAVAKSVHQFTIFASTILACDALCHAVPRSLVCKRLP
jgi:hypothetical protein